MESSHRVEWWHACAAESREGLRRVKRGLRDAHRLEGVDAVRVGLLQVLDDFLRGGARPRAGEAASGGAQRRAGAGPHLHVGLVDGDVVLLAELGLLEATRGDHVADLDGLGALLLLALGGVATDVDVLTALGDHNTVHLVEEVVDLVEGEGIRHQLVPSHNVLVDDCATSPRSAPRGHRERERTASKPGAGRATRRRVLAQRGVACVLVCTRAPRRAGGCEEGRGGGGGGGVTHVGRGAVSLMRRCAEGRTSRRRPAPEAAAA